MENLIGFVGLGSIGCPVVKNLLDSGFNIQVYNRSFIDEKISSLNGIKICPSAKEAAKGCKYFLLCVTDDSAVENVLFGLDGASKSLQQGSIIIDLSTISPWKARSLAKRFLKQQITYIDAPVTGGTEGALLGELTMFLGCRNTLKEKILPILDSIASNYYFFDEVGKGQEVKAINQILIAGTYSALSEAIALGQNLGLPMEVVIKALQQGAASSWALSNRSEFMLKNDYPLGFKLELHHKDLDIALRTAEMSGINLPVTKTVRDIESSLIEQGYGNEDISVLRKSIVKKNS